MDVPFFKKKSCCVHFTPAIRVHGFRGLPERGVAGPWRERSRSGWVLVQQQRVVCDACASSVPVMRTTMPMPLEESRRAQSHRARRHLRDTSMHQMDVLGTRFNPVVVFGALVHPYSYLLRMHMQVTARLVPVPHT